MTLAGRALKIPKLHQHQPGVGVTLVRVPRDRKSWTLRIRSQALQCGPKRQLGLLGLLGLFGLRWLFASQ